MFFLGNKKRNDIILSRVGEFNKKSTNSNKTSNTNHQPIIVAYPANTLRINEREYTNIPIFLKFNNKRDIVI